MSTKLLYAMPRMGMTMTLTNKNTKMILIASIIAIIVTSSVFSTSISSAAEISPPIDITNYFAQARVVFDEIQKLEAQKGVDNDTMSDLTNKIAKTQDNTVEKINLEKELQDLQALVDAKNKRVTALYDELDHFEQLNIAAFKVDDVTRQKFEKAENAIIDTYLNENSTNYIGDNPVETVFAHTKNRNIVILVDPEEITKKGINIVSLKTDFENSIKTTVGEDIAVDIQFGKFHDLACSARDSACRPLVGGVTVAKKSVNTLNTLGYKASKTGEGTGFVIAGHTAQNLDAAIVQPHTDNTKQVGIVRAWKWDSNCDCAYVKVDTGITVNNEIYKSSNLVYSITGKTADASQTVGSWAYKSGARTAVTLGQIVGNLPGNVYNLIEIYHGQGDSGSPVFKITSGDNVSLYGMIYSGIVNPGIGYAKYHPWDHIQSQIGANPP
ncbi:MAG: hypothetical protein ACRD92_02625 [Nitrosopumilaceae archaeon]